MSPSLLIVSREYPPRTHVGGIGTYSATAARIFCDRGWEVHVLCCGEREDVNDDGIHIHRRLPESHPLPKGRMFYPLRHWARSRLSQFLDAWTWAAAVRRFLVEGEFQVGHIEYPDTMGEGALIPPLSRVRTVCRIHSSSVSPLRRNPVEQMALWWLQRRGLRMARVITSPSAFAASHYLGRILRLKRPVRVFPNPFLPWSQAPYPGRRLENLLYLGRVEHRKGLWVLLQALEELGEDARDWRLRIAGARLPAPEGKDAQCDGQLTAALAGRGPRGGSLACDIEYLGQTDHVHLAELFDWAGIFVLPSLMENHPYVLQEALSRGAYVLASRTGGVPEMLRGDVDGLLFEPENSTHLASRMRQCMREGARILGTTKTRSHGTVERFDPEKYFQEQSAVHLG